MNRALADQRVRSLLRDKMCWAVRLALNTVLDAEVEAFIGAAPYARTLTRQDYWNGRYDRGPMS